MSRWKKYTLITTATVLGLLLLSMLVVPWQLNVQARKWFAENSSRRLTIEKTSFNPFSLTLVVEGLKLSEQNSEQPFVSFKRLMLSGSGRSLIDLAVILDRVELDEPFVNIELLGKQQFNFSDFTRRGEETPAAPAEEPREPLHFSLNNIVISGGAVDFTDRTSAKKSQHQIRDLQLSIPVIGNIPYLIEKYVEPQLRLLLNGSELRANGQLKPFHQSLETSLSLTLTEIDLSFYAFHSPVPLPVELKSGVLDSQIDLTYLVSATDVPRFLLSGHLALTDIDIREPNGNKLFLLPTLILDLDKADLLQHEFSLNSLEIWQPQLFVDRDQNGRFNLLKLLPAQTTPSAEPLPDMAEPAALPLLKITHLTLHEGLVHLQDNYPLGGFAETLQGINLRLDNLSTHPEQLTQLAFKLQTARGMSLSLAGQFGLNPLSAELDLLLNDLPLQPHYPYLADLLTRPLEGRLNLATHIQLGPEVSLKLEQLRLALHQLQVPFTDQDHFTLEDFSLTGGAFDLEQLRLELGSITLNDGKLQARRQADGSLSPLALLRAPGDQNEKQAAPAAPGPVSVALPWQKQVVTIDSDKFQLLLNSLVLEQFALHLTDASLAKKPQLKIDRLDVSLENLTYPKSAQSPFRLDARIGRKGSVVLTGTLAHSPLRLQAQTDIQALPLTLLNDFLPEQVKVSLKDGKLFTDLAVTLSQQPEQFTGSFGGGVNISDFNVRDPLTNGELLVWESLSLQEIKGEMQPFALRVKEVSLSNYRANILIDQTGQVNLTSVTAKDAADAAGAPQEPPLPEEVSGDAGGPPADIRIDALTLQGGTVSFTDRHLPRTFATTMYQLGGRVTGLASAEASPADVDLRGQLENHSPLTISGKINPLSKDLFADLTIRFEDIDLTNMSPYSGTYLGYVIDKGKLYLDLSYHIEHQQIEAKNRIMIDQFTFGDSVKSEQATSLPVSLAIALLKDQNGEIHLNVPVSGNLNDPSFSIAGTIFTILRNLLVKAAISPFSLLASMIGGDGEDLSSIAFASGIARLSATDQQQLAKLADLLARRPSLTLEISGFVDPEQDPEAYRQEQLRQMLVAAQRQKQQEDDNAPEPAAQLEIRAEDYEPLLTSVYQDAEFPRPRNFVGLLKSLPVEEMEKLLLSNVIVGEEELADLAKRRAFQVRDTLVNQNAALKGQIFLMKTDIYQAPKKGPASRVEFNISSK